MKAIKYIYQTVIIIALGCSVAACGDDPVSDDNGTTPNTPGTSTDDPALADLPIIDWSLTKDGVKTAMKGYTEVTTSKTNYLEYYISSSKTRVGYSFISGSLASAVIMTEQAQAGAATFSRTGYVEQGTLRGTDTRVYYSTADNAIVCAYDYTATDGKVYFVQGYTPLTSNIYEADETIGIEFSNVVATSSTIEFTGKVTGVTTKVDVKFVYGKDTSLSDAKTQQTTTNYRGGFTISLTGLDAKSTYYYQATATVSGCEYTTGIQSVTTEATSSGAATVNGHECVDLGLSVRWATVNLKADQPQDTGWYFVWGMSTYRSSSYSPSDCGTYNMRIGDIQGNTSYDAAARQWGSSWRLPTKEEWAEVVEKCQITADTEWNMPCYRISGPNANSIFLPSADYYYTDSSGLVISTPGKHNSGLYWSGTEVSKTNSYAFRWYVNSEPKVQGTAKFAGGSIRAVTP